MATPSSVRFGVAVDFAMTPEEGGSVTEAYHRALDRIGLAEQLGFDTVYLSEHHFIPDGHPAAILPLAAAALARTTRIRVSTYVLLLPLHHPVRVAEDVAAMDVVSGGRIGLGLGMGYRAAEFEGLGVPRAERVTRMDEGCELLGRAWLERSWSHRGQHFDLREVDVQPRCVQQPHPPIGISARTVAASRRAVRFRAGLVLPPPAFVEDEARIHQAYVAGLRADGLDPADSRFAVTGSFSAIPTDDPERYRAVHHELRRAEADRYRSWMSEDTAVPTRPASGGNGSSRRPGGVIGTPEACRTALRDLLDGPVPYTDLVMRFPQLEDMARFASEVMTRHPARNVETTT